MTNISIIKSSSDLDNKEIPPVPFSPDSKNEEEEKIDTGDPDSKNSDIL